MATRTSLRDRVRIYELKIDPNGKIWNDNTLNAFIQQAQYQVQQDGNYDWTFNQDGTNTQSTVASQATYSLPSDFGRLELVKYNNQQLKPTTLRELHEKNTTITGTGTPSKYYLTGDNIGLYLEPDAVNDLFILYKKKLAAFTDNTTDNGMPAEFDDAVALYASYLAWKTIDGKQDKAIQALQSYRLSLEGLMAQFIAGRRDEADFGFRFEVISIANY